MTKWVLPVAVALFLGACASSPQTITMSTGSFKNVGNGRATLWLGIVDVAWREDLGGLVDSAEIELECGGQIYPRIVYEDQPTESTCGVQVRLVELFDRSPPAARLQVTWE